MHDGRMRLTGGRVKSLRLSEIWQESKALETENGAPDRS